MNNRQEPAWGAAARSIAAESLASVSTLKISGPYKYAGDTHTSFNVSADDRIIASVYASDGDEDAAEAIASHFAATPEAVERAAKAMAEAEGWRWNKNNQMLDHLASGQDSSRARDTWRKRAFIALALTPDSQP